MNELPLKLSLIVPVYNEGENFPALVGEIEQWLFAPQFPATVTMLVVYDFDGDTTLPVARPMLESRPWLRLLKNDVGRGVVNALRAGFAAVPQGPALVVMADLSDDLSVVAPMLAHYRAGCKVVCASRYMRGGSQQGGPWLKRTLSRCAGVSLAWLGFPTHDGTNNFRLYDAGLVREMGIESSGGFELALELTAKAHRRGVKIAEVPSHWRDRVAGESRFKLAKWLPKYLYWYGYAIASCILPRRSR